VLRYTPPCLQMCMSLPCPCLQEVFLQELAVRAHAVIAADSSRKGLEYRDVGELQYRHQQTLNRQQHSWREQPAWGAGLACIPALLPHAATVLYV
jgi:hypothetical protein